MTGRRAGSEAVEFALVLPVLLALVFALLEFGWYFNRSLVVSAATRDAARAAAMVPEDGDAETVARDAVASQLATLYATAEVQIATTVEGTAPDRTVTVDVRVPYEPITGRFIPSPDAIRSTTTLRMEPELAR